MYFGCTSLGKNFTSSFEGFQELIDFPNEARERPGFESRSGNTESPIV